MRSLSPFPPKSPPQIENSILKAYEQLRKTQSLPISLAESITLAKDLSVNDKIVDYANGDWRIIIFASIDITIHIEQQIRQIFEASNDKQCLIQYSLWQSMTSNEYPVTEIGWNLSQNGKLSLATLYKIINLKVDQMPRTGSSRSMVASIREESRTSLR